MLFQNRPPKIGRDDPRFKGLNNDLAFSFSGNPYRNSWLIESHTVNENTKSAVEPLTPLSLSDESKDLVVKPETLYHRATLDDIRSENVSNMRIPDSRLRYQILKNYTGPPVIKRRLANNKSILVNPIYSTKLPKKQIPKSYTKINPIFSNKPLFGTIPIESNVSNEIDYSKYVATSNPETPVKWWEHLPPK